MRLVRRRAATDGRIRSVSPVGDRAAVPAPATGTTADRRRRRRHRHPRLGATGARRSELLAEPDRLREQPSRAPPPAVWDIDGAGDATIQGFATDISVNVGAADRLQDRHRRDARTRSTSTGSATTAATAPARSPRSTPSATLPQTPADLRHRRRRPRSTTAATGRVSASWTVPSDRRLRRLHRPADPHRHRRRQPDPVRRARRRQPLGRRLPDLRHHLAGLQHLRRRRTSTTAARQRPGLQGQLQPAVHHPRRQPAAATSCSATSTR